MRSIIIIALAALAVNGVHAEVKGQASVRAGGLQPAKSELQSTATNIVHRFRKGPNLVYSGIAVQTAKSRNPLQMINPFAPASYGSGVANTVPDARSGRADGLKVFAIGF